MKRKKLRALASALLLAGCSAAPAAGNGQEGLQEEYVLESYDDPEKLLSLTDRHDGTLASYKAVVSETYASADGMSDETGSVIWIEFDEDWMYQVTQFTDSSWRVARYQLKNPDVHTLEGTSLTAVSGIYFFMNNQGTINTIMQPSESFEVEDPISIAAAFLEEGCTYTLVDKQPDFAVIQVEDYKQSASVLATVTSQVRFTVNKELYLEKAEYLQDDEAGTFTASKILTFSGWNETVLNREQLEKVFAEIAAGTLGSGSAVDPSGLFE